MKKIRIDYYKYRLRKGRADILLQIEKEEYLVPYRYVEEDEYISTWDINNRIEDDGDLTISYSQLNDCHRLKKENVWMPLSQISGLTFKHRESRCSQTSKILSTFMTLCPQEEAGLKKKILSLIDDELVKDAKKRYVKTLQRALDGKPIVVFDAYVTQPDPDLIREEMETLSHFKLGEKFINSYGNEMYSYDRIDWESFGAITKPIIENL